MNFKLLTLYRGNVFFKKLSDSKIIIFSFCLLLFFSCNQSSQVDFSTEVKPLLNKHCISCHGGVKKQGGFSLLFEHEALAQLESGHFGIVPGNARKSEMIKRLTHEDPEVRMPQEKEKLSDSEISLLTNWVNQGAKWGRHWAYEAVMKPEIPILKDNKSTIKVDLFIYKKQIENDLTPSPEALPATLARRVALDVIGYPAPDSIKSAFLSNPNANTYEEMVDKMLESKQYGEKWATMWQDLARYADTKGYERDPDRKIWHYRDWLIKAFNEDMPYDEFITLQLAGDLLPNPTHDQYLATAFHRNTMTNDEGGTDNEEFRTEAILDRVNTTWETLLGTTFACVQCHGHPYDPFVHEEYYKFAAFFNNSRDEDTFSDYPLLRHYDDEQLESLGQIEKWVDKYVSEEEKSDIIRFMKTLSPARNSLTLEDFVNAELADTKWLAFRNNASAKLKDVLLTGKDVLLLKYMPRKFGGKLDIRLDDVEGKIIGSQIIKKEGKGWLHKEISIQVTEGVHDIYFTYKHPSQIKSDDSHVRFDWMYFMKSLPGQEEDSYADIKSKFSKLIEANVPTTPIMLDNPKDLYRPSFVFERGSRLSPGKEVTPSVPQSLNEFPDDQPNNRLGLAHWLTDVNNPLTARTITNRIWEQLYGTGLVETLEDMGSQGASPTHQDLLDYLSWKLMHEYNWSIKKLIKEIVLSQTYKQSSKIQQVHSERDIENKYLSRMNRVRLSGEQIRDQALFVSGVLNLEMYGPPVMPYQPEGVWLSPYNGGKWIKSEGDQKYRRAIYTYWKRTSPYPSMMTFDGVGREVCSSRRIRTNTPLQALVTLNDSVYFELSNILADRVWDVSEEVKDRIELAYKLSTGAEITDKKLSILETLYQRSLANFNNNPKNAIEVVGDTSKKSVNEFAALTMVANSIINLDEVIMKN